MGKSKRERFIKLLPKKFQRAECSRSAHKIPIVAGFATANIDLPAVHRSSSMAVNYSVKINSITEYTKAAENSQQRENAKQETFENTFMPGKWERATGPLELIPNSERVAEGNMLNMLAEISFAQDLAPSKLHLDREKLGRYHEALTSHPVFCVDGEKGGEENSVQDVKQDWRAVPVTILCDHAFSASKEESGNSYRPWLGCSTSRGVIENTYGVSSTG